MNVCRYAAIARYLAIVVFALGTASCTHLKYASVQAEYARIQRAAPAQLNAKHMIERSTFFVHGRCIDATGQFHGKPMAIAAYSSLYQANERVDTMHFQVAGSHYGLNLPEGRYEFLVFADIDGDGILESSEVVGARAVELDPVTAPQRVVGQVDLVLGDAMAVDWPVAIEIPAARRIADSLFYPAGTIRSLDDPIFDPAFSTLGMYDPASFLERAPTMFYALEEDLGYKIPVVFVHGIAGSARDFESLVERLDRRRYKPWFFHYPSGGDLEQLAQLFYQIFLSGRLHKSSGMPLIVVAHSMGGLIVREAVNQYKGAPTENSLDLLITLASPFGGHPAAASGEKHGLIVLPSWRDLNPENAFIARLYRKPLPGFVHHELISAFQNPRAFKLGDNSDGVVPLASQLDPRAQQQAGGQFGFDSTHTGILDSDAVADHILALMSSVENVFPESHLLVLDEGGYDVELGPDYTPMAVYVIRSIGKYVMALSDETLTPFHPEQTRFVEIVRGERAPGNDTEKDWLRFMDEHPELRGNP